VEKKNREKGGKESQMPTKKMILKDVSAGEKCDNISGKATENNRVKAKILIPSGRENGRKQRV